MPDRLPRELTRALRRLRQSPGFTAFAIVTLALGVGVTTAAYAVLYSGFWRPTGIVTPDELVFLRAAYSYSGRSQAMISADDFAR